MTDEMTDEELIQTMDKAVLYFDFPEGEPSPCEKFIIFKTTVYLDHSRLLFQYGLEAKANTENCIIRSLDQNACSTLDKDLVKRMIQSQGERIETYILDVVRPAIDNALSRFAHRIVREKTLEKSRVIH